MAIVAIGIIFSLIVYLSIQSSPSYETSEMPPFPPEEGETGEELPPLPE